MKDLRLCGLILLLFFLVGGALPCFLQPPAVAMTSAQSGQGAVAQAVQPSALRIVSPKSNEKIAQTFVTVQYEQLTPASAAGMPTYELRLDGRDPVHITDTSYTFTGLKPGSHDLIVQLIDANGIPISGTRTEVTFVIVGSGTAGGQTNGSPPSPPQQVLANLPDASSSLPLLSVIGFGVLVGGVISALRTRSAHK